MPRYLPPYAWRLPVSILSLLSTPIALACAFLGAGLLQPIFDLPRMGRFLSSVPESLSFLFWWDTTFVLVGSLLFSIFTTLLTLFITRKYHLNRNRHIIAYGALFELFFATNFLLSQKTGFDVFAWIGFMTFPFITIGPLLPLLASKKERLVAFFVSCLFIAGSVSITRFLILLID